MLKAKRCLAKHGEAGSKSFYLSDAHCDGNLVCFLQLSMTATSSTAIAVPDHKLSESPTSRSIEVGGWLITTSTRPISNAKDLDALQSSLGFPLPEMTTAADAAKVASAVVAAVAAGDLTPLEAGELSRLLESFTKVLEASEFEERLRKLETKTNQ